MGRKVGSTLIAGLIAAALGLTCLFGAVVRLAAGDAGAHASAARDPTQHVPTRTRDKVTPRENRPPVRLWRGPGPATHPPKPRRALA